MRANITRHMCIVVWDLDRDSLRVRNVAVLKYPTSIVYSQKYADGACKPDWRIGERRPNHILIELHVIGFHRPQDEFFAVWQYGQVIGWRADRDHFWTPKNEKRIESRNLRPKTSGSACGLRASKC